MENLSEYCLRVAKDAKKASRALAAVSGAKKNEWINLCADKLLERKDEILAENARKKAIEQAKHLQNYVLAEDSGICVDFLNGAPGVLSARFAGENPRSDQRNNEFLLEKLADVPLEKRTAHYVCHMVLAAPNGEIEFEAEERCRGRILLNPSGNNGFGYDPLFEVVEFHRTFGELAPEIKRAISHRARATRRLIPKLFEMVAAGKLPTM